MSTKYAAVVSSVGRAWILCVCGAPVATSRKKAVMCQKSLSRQVVMTRPPSR